METYYSTPQQVAAEQLTIETRLETSLGIYIGSPGDWITSLNGIPRIVKNEDFRTLFSTADEIRMMFQSCIGR